MSRRMRITIFVRQLPDGTDAVSVGGSQRELITTSAESKRTLGEWLAIAYEQGKHDAQADIRDSIGLHGL